jgi:hypothetical protein
VGDKVTGALEEGVVDVVVEPAEPVVTVGQTRSAEGFEQIEDLLPVVESIQDRRKTPEVEQQRAPPDHVTRNAVELGSDHAGVFGPDRHLDLGRPLHRADEGVGVVHGRKVVDAAGVRQELRPRPVLPHLLVHPVDVADHGLGPLDPLTIHGQEHAQDAVSGRMLRPQVEHEGLLRGIAAVVDGNEVLLRDHGL